MGTWGLGVLEDDLAADVYADYIESHDAGVDSSEATRKLLAKYQSALSEPPFWFGLAQAQWECGALSSETLREVERMVASDADASRWVHGDSRNKRRVVIARFLKKLSVPRTRPRGRVKRQVLGPVFAAGTCLSVPLLTTGFGAAIVLKVETTKRDTRHLVGGLRGVSKAPPTLERFERRDWLVLTHGKWVNVLHLVWCWSASYEQDLEHFRFDVVGTTTLRADDPQDLPAGGASWGWIENQIRLQHEFEAPRR